MSTKNNITFKEIDWIDPKIVLNVFENDNLLCALHSTLPKSSSSVVGKLARYSFISANPFTTLRAEKGDVFLNDTKLNKTPYDLIPFDVINSFMNDYRVATNPNLPPFQGGLMGYFGYEMGSYIEKIPLTGDLPYADMVVGIYDWTIAFDHHLERAYITSCGFNNDANTTINEIETRIKTESKPVELVKPEKTQDLKTYFTKDEYMSAVAKVIDYIYEGDIFEANLTQPFSFKYNNATPLQVYQYLSHINPAPFSAYMNCGDMVIASSSPERFIVADKNGLVETRPIKGTRPRGKDKEEDKKLADELLGSEKDRAENVMIVDLMRNDLSKVCKAGSINVPQVCGLESYESVHHLVSVIRGVLSDDNNVFDLLKSSFPGGSITGAPKIRSQEIISELEPIQRGVYCGCVGYVGFDGAMDTNIAIRTIVLKDNVATFNGGGAVVSDSDPETEYEETLVKARKIFQVFE
ncbi:MAG: aminodeoxychorismate synthase component I [Alphaproteobacteria bacterium]